MNVQAHKSKNGTYKPWMKPIVIAILGVMFFTTTTQATMAVVGAYSGAKDNNIEAAWIDWDDVTGVVSKFTRKLLGEREVAETLTSNDFDGTSWVISPPKSKAAGYFERDYNTKGYGAKSEKGPLSKETLSIKEGESDGDKLSAADGFMAYQLWAAQYGVYSSLDWSNNAVQTAINWLGRSLGAGLLFVVTAAGQFVDLIGQLVYQALDTFNVFKYILPDSTSNELFGKFEYNTADNSVLATFAEWLNFGRFFGYLLAILLFVAGLGLSVLGFKIGKSRSMSGSIFASIQRLLVSVFAMTSAIFLLSAMITLFAENMQRDADDLTVEASVSGLILDYESYVTRGYAYDPASLDDEDGNKDFKVSSKNVESLGVMERHYNGKGVPVLRGTDTLSTTDIQAMNEYSGAIKGDPVAEGEGIVKYFNRFMSSDATTLIAGWGKGESTSSATMKARYGDDSMPYAIYRVNTTKDGIMTIEDGGLFSTSMKYQNYTIPGGIGGFFRYFQVVGSIGLVVAFAALMYMVMFRSILSMVGNVFIELPSAIGLGTMSGLFLLFGAVITMIIQVTIARIMIVLFKDVIDATHLLFPLLSNIFSGGLSSGPSGEQSISTIMQGAPLPFGTITPFAVGTESTASIIVTSVLLWAVGGMLFKGFYKLNSSLGSSISGFFTDLSHRISGLNYHQQGSELDGSGTSETTTTTESEDSSMAGTFSDGEADNMGLGGSVIGGIGAMGSSLGGSTSSGLDQSTDGYMSEDEDANQDRLNEKLSPESALASSNMDDENEMASFGSVGDDSVNNDGEEEDTVSTTKSSSGSEGFGANDSSALSDNVSSDSDMDGEESFGDVGSDEDSESESERRHMEHVVADQSVDNEESDDADMAFGEGDESLENERSMDAIDRVNMNTDQDIDDMNENDDGLDASAQRSAADQSVTGADSMYNVDDGSVMMNDDSANDSGIEDYDTGNSDMDAISATNADADQKLDMDGSDRSLDYNVDDGETAMNEDTLNYAQDDAVFDDLDANQSNPDQSIDQNMGAEDATIDMNTQMDDSEYNVDDHSVDDRQANDYDIKPDEYNLDNADSSSQSEQEALVNANEEDTIAQTVSTEGTHDVERAIEDGSDMRDQQETVSGETPNSQQSEYDYDAYSRDNVESEDSLKQDADVIANESDFIDQSVNVGGVHDVERGIHTGSDMMQDNESVTGDNSQYGQSNQDYDTSALDDIDSRDTMNNIEQDRDVLANDKDSITQSMNTRGSNDTDYSINEGSDMMDDNQSLNGNVSAYGHSSQGYDTSALNDEDGKDTISNIEQDGAVLSNDKNFVRQNMNSTGYNDTDYSINEGSNAVTEMNDKATEAPNFGRRDTLNGKVDIPTESTNDSSFNTGSDEQIHHSVNKNAYDIDTNDVLENNDTVNPGSYTESSATTTPKFGKVPNGAGNYDTNTSGTSVPPLFKDNEGSSEPSVIQSSPSEKEYGKMVEADESDKQRAGKFVSKSNKTTTTTTTTTKNEPNTSDSGYQPGSYDAYGYPVQPPIGGSLGSDLSNYFGSNRQQAPYQQDGMRGPVPYQTQQKPLRQPSSKLNSTRKSTIRPKSYSTEEHSVTHESKTDEFDGLFGEDGLFSGTKETTRKTSKSSGPSAKKDTPKFGKRD